ncbi:hypothetical protein ACFL47_04445 [Candidatus Latescibacterota bacterium]
MEKKFYRCASFLLIVIFWISAVEAKILPLSWHMDAAEIYEQGFTHNTMKNDNGDVTLFNMDLKQNDAPGAGHSEKGIYYDPVFGPNRARKILFLDDPRTFKAWLVVFSYQDQEKSTTSRGGSGKYKLKFRVNNNEEKIFDSGKPTAQYSWVEFPSEWLIKGENVIELYCPEANDGTDSSQLFLARADEFEHGGGDPSNVGKTSFKSTDGGETWKESPFGPLGQTRAEYSVRISLDRYVKTGWTSTPIIDLWRLESDGLIVPNRTLTKMYTRYHMLKIRFESKVPKETKINYYMRKSSEPDPHSEKWGPYELITDGTNPTLEINGMDIGNRYIQIKAELTTENPLVTPVLKSVSLEGELTEFLPQPENIKVISVDNPPIKYSSINWEWEPWDRPEFAEVRDRESLDELMKNCRTQFQHQIKLLNYANFRFNYLHPMTDFPEWTSKNILERIDRLGTGGMCIQYNNLLMGFLLAYGYQSRLITIPGHEVCEVWNDDFKKWIYMDASHVNQYIFHKETHIPQNILENHITYLEIFPPDSPLDWMKLDNLKEYDPDKLPTNRGSLTHHEAKNGAYSSANRPLFMRTVPRNNYYEKPYDMPLTHGNTWWPWDGYINWYDSMTPPMRHYSHHTNRERDMYPDLNTVHIHATTAYAKDMVYLNFETYTPNFSHFEVTFNEEDEKTSGSKCTWFLVSGENKMRVRSVSKLGVKGHPSSVVIRYVDLPQVEFKKLNY